MASPFIYVSANNLTTGSVNTGDTVATYTTTDTEDGANTGTISFNSGSSPTDANGNALFVISNDSINVTTNSYNRNTTYASNAGLNRIGFSTTGEQISWDNIRIEQGGTVITENFNNNNWNGTNFEINANTGSASSGAFKSDGNDRAVLRTTQNYTGTNANPLTIEARLNANGVGGHLAFLTFRGSGTNAGAGSEPIDGIILRLHNFNNGQTTYRETAGNTGWINDNSNYGDSFYQDHPLWIKIVDNGSTVNITYTQIGTRKVTLTQAGVNYLNTNGSLPAVNLKVTDSNSNSTNASSTSSITDGLAPTLGSSSPSDNATAVAVNSNIVLTFSEAVDAESGNILIKKTSDNSIVETIDVTSGQVTGSGTTTITINPGSDLATDTEYYVQIAATAFDDTASNSYAGITNTTNLSFKTVDTIDPTLGSSNPADDATAVGVNSNLVLNFSEAVEVETGNIVIYKSSDDSIVETIAVDGGLVTGTGTNQITINPSVTLASDTEYYVQIAATAFDDTASNSFAGITDKTSYSFTTADVIDPILSSSTPYDNQFAFSTTGDIVLNFSEAVDVETGNILIKKTSDNSTIETIDVTSAQVIGTGTNTIKINPSITLLTDTEYYIQIAATAFDDAAGNSYAGISDTTSLSFTTDYINPTITGPSGTSTGATTSSLDFSENLSAVHTFTSNKEVTWSIRGGADKDLFNIDATKGALTFKTTPDFENPLDADKNNTYEVTVFATDSQKHSSNQTITISITDGVNDDINGTDLADALISTSTNEMINGGLGDDTVTFSGKFSDYSFIRQTNSIQVIDQRTGNNDGTDTLTSIEQILFTDQLIAESNVDVSQTYNKAFHEYTFYNKGDGTYEIKTGTEKVDITGIPSLTFSDQTVSAIADIKGTFDQVTGINDSSGHMFRLYSAAFKRLPDADGLKYWIGTHSAGTDSNRAVAQSFINSSEFSERFGENISNEKYVETLYTNVLGRTYDQDGYDYWVGNLNDGSETKAELLLGFAESAENKTLFTEMTGLG